MPRASASKKDSSRRFSKSLVRATKAQAIKPLPRTLSAQNNEIEHFPVIASFQWVSEMLSYWFQWWTGLPMKHGGNLRILPKLETSESANGYKYHFYLPGIPHDQVRLNITKNNMLELIARSKNNRAQRGHRETSGQNLTHLFSIPRDGDTNAATASFKADGLEIVIPKTDGSITAKTRSIKIS